MWRSLLAGCFFICFSGLAGAQSLSNDLRVQARQALEAGDFQSALAQTDRVLAINPTEPVSLMIRAVALRSLGRFEESLDAATTAFSASDDTNLRFEAALLAGELNARLERFTRSQFWLRRADQIAPPQLRPQVANAFRQVAAQNPLSFNLSFGIIPSDNVNNGSESTIIGLDTGFITLSDEDQALGGTEVSFGASVSYRLAQDETSRTDFLFDLAITEVFLDSEAETLAPGVEDSDFDFAATVVALRHRELIWPELGATEGTLIAGRSWSGGDPQAFWRELSLRQFVVRDERNTLTFGARFRNETRDDQPIAENNTFGVSFEWNRLLDGGNIFAFGASVNNTTSESASIDNLALRVFARRTFSQVGAVQPSLLVSATTQDFSKFSVGVDGRRDNTLNLRLDFTFPDISYFGFVPQATLEARRVFSDLDAFERQAVSVGLTAVSRF